MNLWLVKLKTYWQLGIANVFTVAIYRILKKAGLFRKTLPIKDSPQGHFFLKSPNQINPTSLLRYFGHKNIEVTSPPDWLLNPYNNKRVKNNKLHWSEHEDFDPDLGDIKMVWEASRFDWLPKLAWRSHNGDKDSLSQIEIWLRSWVQENPSNQGVNWKCGQEASFRCLNLLVAMLLIDSSFETPTIMVKGFLYQHLKRISSTLRYAMAQDNNHGTSEASALFVGGYYLSSYGDTQQQKACTKWSKQGRKWLENRVKKLIMEDGSFSQNSVVYHRLLVDTLSMTELFRRKLNLSKFSDSFYKKAKLATLWLYTIADDVSGDAPNIGANDGSYLFNLTDSPYRDFRPSIQLARLLFDNSVTYSSIIHPLQKVFRDIELPHKQKKFDKNNKLFDSGGYIKLTRQQNSFAILRLPIYRFRPSDADALHLDIWHNGENILRDAGTYSYNAKEHELKYFPGTQSHNTIFFDNHDQMPRLSRFLFGRWLQSKDFLINKHSITAMAAYRTPEGIKHKRSLISTREGWQVTDWYHGFKHSAILHWGLPIDEWHLENNLLIGRKLCIRITSPRNEKLMIELTERSESIYYGEKTVMPLLRVDCSLVNKITTDIIVI